MNKREEKELKEGGNAKESFLVLRILRVVAIVFVFISILAPWIVNLLVSGDLNIKNEEGKWVEMSFAEKLGSLGTVGDWLGGSTLPWLTFATTFLLIETSIMQRRQLHLQRKEMEENARMLSNQIELQKEEMQKTNQEFNLQNETMKIQRFENTFFNMLSLHNQLIEKITFTESTLKGEKILTGKNALPHIYENFESIYTSTIKHLDKIYELSAAHLGIVDRIDLRKYRKIKYRNRSFHNAVEIPIEYCGIFKNFVDTYMENNELLMIFVSYDTFYKKYHNNLGHYFRSLYRIVKYVDETDLINSKEQKEFYTDYIRSQFSSFEHLLLFYNCISDKGFSNFLPLLNKYDLLDGLDKNLLIDEIDYYEYIKYSCNPNGKNRDALFEFFIDKMKLFKEVRRISRSISGFN